MDASKNVAVVVLTGVAYFLLFLLNDLLFSSFGYSEGVSWIFLPSGLRLAFVLIFVELGAVGICLASMAISYRYQFGGDLITIVGAGFISGFAPWLARIFCMDKLKLDMDLHNLTANTLLKVSIIFALLSAVLHQIWGWWRGHTENFISTTMVMAVGDLVGTILMLLTAKFILKHLPRSKAT